MSKYIIELNEDCKIVQQMCVTEHGNAYTDGCYSCDLEELNFDYINEHYGELQDKAYQKGINDGTAITNCVEAIEQLPPAQPDVPDINVGDMISRQAAIDIVTPHDDNRAMRDALEELPPAQPDIIRCRNCKFASGDSRICMKFGHSPIGELDFCTWAERRTDEE